MRTVLTYVALVATLCFCLFSLLGGPVQAKGKGKRGGTFVYVHDPAFGSPHKIHAFRMTRQGQLAELDGSPFLTTQSTQYNLGGGTNSMSHVARGKLLVTTGDTFVTSWRIAKDGSLSIIEEHDLGGAGVINSLAVVGRGRSTYVIATSYAAGTVHTLLLERDGTFTELDASPSDTFTRPLLAGSRRRTLFIHDQNDLHALNVERDGSLTAAPGSPLTDTTLLGIGPRGRVVLVEQEDGIRALPFNSRTGEIGANPGEAVTTDLANNEYGVSLSKRGVALIVEKGNDTTGTQAYRFDKRTLALTKLGEPQDTGLVRPRARAIARRGKLLVAASTNDPAKEVRTYAIDRATGELTVVDHEPLTESSNTGVVLIIRR